MVKKMIFRMLIAAVLPVVVISGCSKGMRKEPNIELIQDMMEQPALKPQDFHPDDRTKPSALMPPEGTVPVGFKPYPYHLNPEAAEANLKNPFAGDLSPERLKIGRQKYDTYCAVCHGYEGKGDGPVAPKMALRPPSLLTDKVVNFKDARIFHIITDGQGVMASYAFQIVDENDRWAIVNYIRSLQKLGRGAGKTADAGKTEQASAKAN